MLDVLQSPSPHGEQYRTILYTPDGSASDGPKSVHSSGSDRVAPHPLHQHQETQENDGHTGSSCLDKAMNSICSSPRLCIAHNSALREHCHRSEECNGSEQMRHTKALLCNVTWLFFFGK